MTELEFEKSCRGTSDPVSNEYAWGTSTIVTYSTLINAGTANETSSTVTANATTRTANILAPTRVGMFAKTGNTRVQSGATFYGILDMTGNLWERPVTVGNPQGRSYTGKHGNGTITPAGKADVEYWPTTEGIGSGYRGGYWNSQSSEKVLCTADRQYAAQYSDRRRERYGIRGVRTATAP
jgi:formylglycine-generating enzyme required for sulfatase activity